MEGSGTENDPYLVDSAEDLNDVRNDLSAYYLQTGYIDLTGWEWDSIDSFEGVYDGNNYTIENLLCPQREDTMGGLFGYCQSGTVLKNINVEGTVYDTTGISAGGGLLANQLYSDDDSETLPTIVENCHAEGSVILPESDGRWGGGLVGNISIDFDGLVSIKDSTFKGEILAAGNERIGGLFSSASLYRDFFGEGSAELYIENCHVDIDLESAENSGGFFADVRVEENTELTILDSSSAGKLTCTTSGNRNFGGFCNSLEVYDGGDFRIERCWTTCDVEVEASWLGGFIADLTHANTDTQYPDGDLLIKNCYAYNNVRDTSSGDASYIYYVGGFIGYISTDNGGDSDLPLVSIINSYSAGLLEGYDDIGGFIAYDSIYAEGANVESCYFDEDLAGTTIDDSEAEPRTTEEMTEPYSEESTYIGWDFEEVWSIDEEENDGYPFLYQIDEGGGEEDSDYEVIYFNQTPEVKKEPPTANSVTVISPESEYTEEPEGLSDDERVERMVEIEEGNEEVCKKVAEGLYDKWSREQKKVVGSIDLNLDLDLKEKVKVNIDEALIEEEKFVIRKMEHQVMAYNTVVSLGDNVLEDNELLARLLDNLL